MIMTDKRESESSNKVQTQTCDITDKKDEEIVKKNEETISAQTSRSLGSSFKKKSSDDAIESGEDEENDEEVIEELSQSPSNSRNPPFKHVDINTPDRPGRPSAPTPGKYGTMYGGAPSPGPAPTSAFQPPGFIPPTPPAPLATVRSGSTNIRKKCLQGLLSEESKLIQEEYQEEKKRKLDCID